MRVLVNKHIKVLLAYSTFLRFMRLVRSDFALPESLFVSTAVSECCTFPHFQNRTQNTPQ